MNLLLVCDHYHPFYGGAELLFKNLAERLTQQGNSCLVLTHRLKDTSKKEILNKVEIQRVPSFFSRYVFTFFAIPRALRLARHSDLLQTTTFNGAFPAWLAGKLWKKPVVLTVHEVWQGKWRTITGFSWLKSKLHDWLEMILYKFPFDAYVCVSEATKKQLLKLGLPEEKIRVVYNGLDYDFWNKQTVTRKNTEVLRKKHHLGKKFVLFSWGRPGPSKGFEFLLKAMPLVIRQIPQVTLLLMFGSREKYPQKYRELLDLLNKINLPQHIQVLDSVSYEELRTYVAAADAIVVPSIAEGFGYTTAEAVALGKPVIVSNAGSLPEVVAGNHWIFQAKEVPALAEKIILGAQGKWQYKEPQQFSWDTCVEGYVQLYEELINRRT